MNWPIRNSVAALGILLALTTGKAFSQVSFPASPYSPYTRTTPAGPFGRPALSPYLNLLRGGNPAANYYLGVIPEQQRRAAYSQFGSALQQLEERSYETAQPQEEELLPTLPQTGHPVGFLNYAPYFTSGNYSYGRPGQAPGRASTSANPLQQRPR